MDFYALLDQVTELLRRRDWVTHRALKLQFKLDDDHLEVLKDELIKAQRVAMDENGDVLVWVGGVRSTPAPVQPSPQSVQQSVPQEDRSAHVESPSAEPRPLDAERRQLTVLFCDLVDSTALASQLDPEEWREVVRAYQETCAKVIARFGGHIAQYLGDGLLVYFGYPLAHEDDAQRAVRAGLGMVEAVGQLNMRLAQERGVSLAVRVGIHTGLVVVGEVGGGTRQEQLALGEPPNVAARLQGLAESNTVVVSAATLQLLGGFFACQPLGTHRLKGLAQPLEVYQVLSESTARNRLDAAGSTGLTPLVGREPEVGLLQEREDRYELTGHLPPLAIPATLHDSLMARLDRLATVKGFAQLGATLGREFSYTLLQAVTPWDEATLPRGLQQLVGAEFLYQQELPPQATYLFKHALIQEAAYQSLLKSTRQQHHQRIAQVLEARFPEVCATQPELLAHHYMEACVMAQAIPYWQWAGQRAIERSANLEAIGHLTKGLEVLKTLPDTPDRTRQELDLQTALGPALRAIQGWSSPEAEQAYTRARELCQRVGETPQLFPVLFGLWTSSIVRPEFQTARKLGEQLLSLGQNASDPTLLTQAHWVLGFTLFFMGAFGPARAHLERVIALYDPQQHRSHTLLYGQDPGATALYYAAWALWYLGYPNQALQRGHQAVTLAQELSHPFSLAFALEGVAELYQFRREVRLTQERAEALMTLSTEQRFAFWVVSATVLRGWALAEQGQGEEGIVQLRQGLAAWQAMGEALYQPRSRALLAEIYGNVGRTEEGLTVLAEVLADVHNTGLCYCEAELYRLKGELLLQHAPGSGDDAELCFRQALDIARRQQAKSLELRAAMSLARLWQRQGKRAEARELLAPVYGWFTEGFDTADLQKAKALLKALA